MQYKKEQVMTVFIKLETNRKAFPQREIYNWLKETWNFQYYRNKEESINRAIELQKLSKGEMNKIAKDFFQGILEIF